MKLWEIKINSIVVHSGKAKIGVVTGLQRRQDGETIVKVIWDDKGTAESMDVAWLLDINQGRYEWVMRERKRKVEENEQD